MSDHTAQFVPGLEKANYTSFVRHNVAYRTAMIPHMLTDFTTLQLPSLSTLHTINHFLHYDPKDDINPDMHNPLIFNEQWPIYLQHCTTLPGAHTLPFPVADHYTYTASKYKAAALAFFHHQPKIRRLLSEAATARLSNALVLNEYAALNHVRLTGQLASYRHFDIIFRSILNHICNSRDTRYHFLQFPLSEQIYTRTQFLKTFSQISTSTLRIQNDPSYYLLIHLLGFVYGVTAESPVPYPPADLAVQSADHNLPPLTSTSLLSRIPDTILSRLNIILTHGHHAIIYNLQDLKVMSEHPSMFLRILRHINTLKLNADTATLPDDHLDDTAFDDSLAQHQDSEPLSDVNAPIKPLPAPVAKPPSVSPVINTTPPPTSTVLDKPPSPVNLKTVSSPKNTTKPAFDFHRHIVTHLETTLKTAVDQTEVAPTRVEDLYHRHMSVTIAGKTIAEHIAIPLENIHTNTLDFLDGKLPDATMATSSIANFDKLYIKSGFQHDLAKTLTSLVAHGMFVTHVDEIPQVTQWSRRTVYKVALTDLAGKRHSLVFAFPQVNDAGQMLINGVPSRMTKQQINLPICKISEDRVNLSSNYNKTLLGRISTRRHNFSSYFTKYLTMLRMQKLVTAYYGKLPNSPIKLPYDYSAIGQTYTRIEGSDGVLIFDYHHRFDNYLSQVSVEEYTEDDSVFEHDHRNYSLTTLLAETEQLPVQQFNVSDLAWVLEDNPPDLSRSIDDTDLTAPILVTEWHGKLVVIDGAHRLAKAVKLGLKTIPGHLVPADMLKRHLIEVEKLSLKTLRDLEKQYGVFCGQTKTDGLLFMGMDNHITIVNYFNDIVGTAKTRFTTVELLRWWYPSVTPPTMVSEWTELNVLSENFPTIFVLGFRFGLTAVLKDAHIQTTWVTDTEKPHLRHDDLIIPFSDGSLIINRYPLKDSLLIAGLLKFSTKDYYRAEFDSPDVYYRILMQAGISINYLKGINSFFDYFLDPITLDVLHEMGEPTTVKGLLLRANEMVSTYDHYPTSSMRNHRLRGYERFSSILYNEVSRQLAAYSGKRQSKKSFSINPEAVFQRIMQDSTISTVETINPISELKDNTGLTYAGSGARTAQSFVVEDRRYPDDGVGVLSEATPDSGKVALNAYTSADPKLANLRGMFDYDDNTLTPSNILSSTALLMPCSVQDDKRL